MRSRYVISRVWTNENMGGRICYKLRIIPNLLRHSVSRVSVNEPGPKRCTSDTPTACRWLAVVKGEHELAFCLHVTLLDLSSAVSLTIRSTMECLECAINVEICISALHINANHMVNTIGYSFKWYCYKKKPPCFANIRDVFTKPTSPFSSSSSAPS